MADTSNWLNGAVAGFAAAFLIQAFAGHWKLWVDSRKSIIDDLIKSIDAAQAASAAYFAQDVIPAGQAEAREVIYTQKVVTDLFGIINKRFGPASSAVDHAFRAFREETTGEGFMRGGAGDKTRAATIAIYAASASSALRDWSVGELSFFATVATWFRRQWRRIPGPRVLLEDVLRLAR